MPSTSRSSNYDCCIATRRAMEGHYGTWRKEGDQPSTAFVNPLSISTCGFLSRYQHMCTFVSYSVNTAIALFLSSSMPDKVFGSSSNVAALLPRSCSWLTLLTACSRCCTSLFPGALKSLMCHLNRCVHSLVSLLSHSDHPWQPLFTTRVKVVALLALEAHGSLK